MPQVQFLICDLDAAILPSTENRVCEAARDTDLYLPLLVLRLVLTKGEWLQVASGRH